MEQTSDIQENANENAHEAVIADCVTRKEARAMGSELDFFLGVRSALTHYGLKEEAKTFDGLLFLAACGRSVCDPSMEEIRARRAVGQEWDYDRLQWVNDKGE